VSAKARYSDPAATDFIARTLIARRTKVLATWLTAVNPIADARLDAAGVEVSERGARGRCASGPVSRGDLASLR
jgi:hypothetical protein